MVEPTAGELFGLSRYPTRSTQTCPLKHSTRLPGRAGHGNPESMKLGGGHHSHDKSEGIEGVQPPPRPPGDGTATSRGMARAVMMGRLNSTAPPVSCVRTAPRSSIKRITTSWVPQYPDRIRWGRPSGPSTRLHEQWSTEFGDQLGERTPQQSRYDCDVRG